MQNKDEINLQEEEIFYEAEENIGEDYFNKNDLDEIVQYQDINIQKENNLYKANCTFENIYNLNNGNIIIQKKSNINEFKDKMVDPKNLRDTICEDAQDNIEIIENSLKFQQFEIKPFKSEIIQVPNSKINPLNIITAVERAKSSDKEEKQIKEIKKISKEKERERKLALLKEDIRDVKLDIEFLKKNFKQIPTKLKGIKEKHLEMLFELQCFQGNSEKIWAAKISFDGRYIATGGKSGVLQIFEILTEKRSLDYYASNNFLSYFRFVNENTFKIYTEHTQDIIDISWSSIKQNYLLSASLDHYVILWDVNLEYPVQKFFHAAMVSTISFCPNSDEFTFVSGCFDKIIRIWNPTQNKVIDYINVQEYITYAAYFPTGEKIAVGSHTGKCSIYEVKPKLKYSYSFDCKNKAGKFSDGRKITNIEFLNMNLALITTNDSSIRLADVNHGKVAQKYKGLKNEEHIIRASFEEIYDLIISASDDGYTYIWKKINP